MIEFIVPGLPVPKGRMRFRSAFKSEVLLELAQDLIAAVKRGDAVREIMRIVARSKPMVQQYTPPETQAAEEEFGWKAKKFAPRQPLTGPLRVDLVFVLPSPARLDSDRSRVWPHVRPDVDNYTKLAYDAMNGMFWVDDGQVCASINVKRYGHPPRTEVRISRLSDAAETQFDLWNGVTNV